MLKEETFLWVLFEQLRRRRFPLGPDDYYALRQALRAGFGWSSRQALRDLCCALWAKSRQEQEILIALFDHLELPDWGLPQQAVSHSASTNEVPGAESRLRETVIQKISRFVSSRIGPYFVIRIQQLKHLWAARKSEPAPSTLVYRGVPPIRLGNVELPKASFIFVPQFPIGYRDVAQAWRRLRRPVRSGPRSELDVEATVDRRCRLGVASAMVLVPRRRNTARLLLLVDRQGSMAPFHRFVESVCVAIQQSGKLENAALYYFHDKPAEGADKGVLESIAGELFPTLDSVLHQVTPLTKGYIYRDPELLFPLPLVDVLEEHACGSAVVLISDAGAARGRYDVVRLLDTVAFFKALRVYTAQYVWLNPLPRKYWGNNTASQIARHLPMFPLDREGSHRAVNVLRGQPYLIERPI